MMCGIAGTIDAQTDRSVARVSMINRLQAHRGPDHSVVSRAGIFTLGNTRLAIQDPSPAGNQPFISRDGRYHCVFNGEIYNYHQLIDRYRLNVSTSCDGEVIPALWAELGPAALAQFRGMFGIALVDTVQERLYLARDPFGIKPLHWRVLAEGQFVFASEVRTLVQVSPGLQIDSEAIARYLRFGAMAADQSPFRGIKALPPNSVAVVDREQRVEVRPILPNGPLTTSGHSPGLAEVLTESVELHLGANVPTTLLLSAGVDSASIAALGHQLGQSLHCLTVATNENTDESQGAAETALHYGHRFQRVRASLEEADITAFFTAMQRPSIDGLNTYVVCKAVREAGFKVALSGLGGDEAVGGYSHFRLLRYLPALRVFDAMPRMAATATAKAIARAGLAGEPKAMRLLGRGGPRDGRSLSLLQREILPGDLAANLAGIAPGRLKDGSDMRQARVSRSFGAMAEAEVEFYLQSTLLPDADAFSMASSVELRVPFVDTHVFAATLDLAAGKSARPGKAAIGTALDDPFLTMLAARPKRGFTLPMRRWMSGSLAPLLVAAEDPAAPVWSYLDRAAAKAAELLPLRARERWTPAWTLAALNAWLSSVGTGRQE